MLKRYSSIAIDLGRHIKNFTSVSLTGTEKLVLSKGLAFPL